MNIKKKITIFSMSLLILGGAITSVKAFSYTSGSEYQYVTHTDIPACGGISCQTSYGSKKVTTGELATFLATHRDALLGNFACLIDFNKNEKSADVGLTVGTAKVTSEFGCSVGAIYFSAVRSSGIEPSNKCDVTMGFSADNLKS